MTISEMEEWEKANPDWEVLCGAPMIHTGGGLGLKSMRTDDAFKDRIKKIKDTYKGNTIDNYV